MLGNTFHTLYSIMKKAWTSWMENALCVFVCVCVIDHDRVHVCLTFDLKGAIRIVKKKSVNWTSRISKHATAGIFPKPPTKMKATTFVHFREDDFKKQHYRQLKTRNPKF